MYDAGINKTKTKKIVSTQDRMPTTSATKPKFYPVGIRQYLVGRMLPSCVEMAVA